jgi:hypothetical protein
MSNYEEISVINISGGDLIKQIDHQVKEAIKNCLDPNTAAEAMRKITVTIAFKPDAMREKVNIESKVDIKFPGDAPLGDLATISRQKKKGYVNGAQQMSFKDLEVAELPKKDEGTNA